MKTKQNIKIKRLRLFGSLFFALAGIVNFVASSIYVGIQTLDIVILIVSILPLLIRKKMFLLIFGLFACFISLYMGYACLTFSLNPKIQTSDLDFFMGFSLSFFLLIASLALIYVGLPFSDKKEFNLI